MLAQSNVLNGFGESAHDSNITARMLTDTFLVLPPGFNCINCLACVRVRGVLSLRVQQLQVKCDTKSGDDVQVMVEATVQYRVESERARDAFYSLDDPRAQIKAYVLNSVRSTVPKMTLDEVYENKDDIANNVKTELVEIMSGYGFSIISTLVTDIEPDTKVAQAMNEINAAQRLRIAAEDKAEAKKIMVVKAAQADAESKFLSGQGIARQRMAIIDGLKDSVVDFAEGVPGSTPSDVMNLVLLTQYFDTMKDIAADSRAKTVFLPYAPSAMSELREQISMGMMVAGESNSEVVPVPRKMKMEEK